MQLTLPLKKYLTYFTVYWQMLFSYRFDIMIYALSGMLMPLLGLFIWFAVGQGNPNLGMNLGEIVFYFLAVAWCNEVTTTWSAYFIYEDIKSGRIVTNMLKPFSILENSATNNIAEKTIKLSIVTFALIIAGYLFSSLYNLQFNVHTELIPLSLLALIGGAAMMILIDVSIGLCSFWLDEVEFLMNSFLAAELLLSGKFVPIQFLPSVLQSVTVYLPFRYLVSFPIEIIMGKLNAVEILFGFAVLGLWTMTAWVIQRQLYSRGAKHYQSFGG